MKPSDKNIRELLRRRLRLTLVDENRQHNIINLRSTATRFVLTCCALALIAGFLLVTLIVSTPLRSLLPGYLYSYERHDMINNTLLIDSLSNQVSTRNQYVDNIMAILNNEVDTTLPEITDTLPRIISIDSIITASEIERDYVLQYENSQKYNLSVLTPLAAQGITFINPLQGAEARFPEEGEDARRITFDLPRLQPVSATYRGSVLDVYNTIDAGFTVIVQHPNDFISRYSGLTEVMVKRGETVVPGTRLGLIERDKVEKLGLLPTFELWYKGAAVNARDYIPF